MIKITKNPKNRRVFAHVDRLSKKHADAIFNALHEIGRENVQHLRSLIKDKNKTGRIYIVRGRRHQASAPGEAPASLTGRLSRTAGYIVRGSVQMEFGDKAPYGVFLEGGTRKMAPRPHVERTVNERAGDTERSLVTATNDRVTKL